MRGDNGRYSQILRDVPFLLAHSTCERHGDDLVVKIEGRVYFVSTDRVGGRFVVWAEMKPADPSESEAAAEAALSRTTQTYHDSGFAIGLGPDNRTLILGRSLSARRADASAIARLLVALALEILRAEAAMEAKLEQARSSASLLAQRESGYLRV